MSKLETTVRNTTNPPAMAHSDVPGGVGLPVLESRYHLMLPVVTLI